MNIIKFLYPKNSLKRKILDIKDEMKTIIRPICNESFWIDWHGAYDINPKSLVFLICVNSDKEKIRLKSNQDLMEQLKNLLIKYNYPESARGSIIIDVESQETVDRESDGNWYIHLK